MRPRPAESPGDQWLRYHHPLLAESSPRYGSTHTAAQIKIMTAQTDILTNALFSAEAFICTYLVGKVDVCIVGRGATEIDMIEVMPGPPGKLPICKNGLQRPYSSMTLQVS